MVPFGFYGAGNVGDESTLQGFAKLVFRGRHGLRVWVGSRNPAHTANVEPAFVYFKAEGKDVRRWLARTFSKGHLFAGGTPIADHLGKWPLCELAPLVSDAHLKGKPMVFVGIGTEELERAGSRQIMADVIAPKVLHWSVRCERDKERLIEYGAAPDHVTVAADMAWMLDKESTEFGKKYLSQLNVDLSSNLVGVNVNNEKFVLDREPRLFEKLGTFLDAIVEKYGVRILFFCNEVREEESFDKVASQKVQAHMRKPDHTFILPNRYWAPQQILSLLGCCRLNIGMRYHFCLFSALQNVPFIALKRSGKVQDLCWDMDWPYGVSTDGLDVAALSTLYDEAELDRENVLKSLPQKAGVLRERALRNMVTLDALFERLRQ